MGERAGLRVHVGGVVQGVGFRPFVYQLAQRLELKGWVRNTSAGVDIEVDGAQDALQGFIAALRTDAPPLSQIDALEVETRPANGFTCFEIFPSETEALEEAFQPISPDVATCPDCLSELFDPNDRHYRYPFVNCTNCGPRYTIIRALPYDRPMTTMADFKMCPACAEEYTNPNDRRYHAQPVSCPDCGPRIWLEFGGHRIDGQEEALNAVRRIVAEGEIVAIKGLGGFHLACDAGNPEAVALLRRRKARPDKPLAVMLAEMPAVLRNCMVSEEEQSLLQSVQRPIVLLERRTGSTIAAEVAPGQRRLGVMLPYTPLHYLLLESGPGVPEAWVMTSGNRSEEPIVIENEDAREQLGGIAAAFLMHDRPIQARCDDSVLRVAAGGELTPIRRARGYAPMPIRTGWASPALLATGTELKNSFCLAQENYALLSPHIGELQNYETLQAYESAIAHYEQLFRVQPRVIAYDLHPDYLATRYAMQRADEQRLAAIAVQHHHAHIAACMAEHGLPAGEPVIGVAFDGTGYGRDGAIWGGEILLADYLDFQRAYHLDYTPLPGGDLAVRQPWRLGLAWLGQLGLNWDEGLLPMRGFSEEGLRTVKQQIEKGVNTPQTSSMGRLFDAAAVLAGLRQTVTYEGQAAIELEALLDPDETGAYYFEIGVGNFDAHPVMAALLADRLAGVPSGRIAARFHNGVAELVLALCSRLRGSEGISRVALSGGVWQNATLLAGTTRRLQSAGFEVLSHHKVPPNDGGVSLGQAAVASHTLFR